GAHREGASGPAEALRGGAAEGNQDSLTILARALLALRAMKRSWLAIATVVPLTFGALGDVEAEYEGEGRQPRVLSMPEEGPEPSARPFHMNLDELVSNNQLYRDVVFTGRMSQIALMSIPPGDHIGY